MLIANFALNRMSNGILLDTLGYGHVGVCTDTHIVNQTKDRFPQRMSFNGMSSQVAIPSITCPPHFTIATWFKRPAGRTFFYEALVAFGNDTPFFGFYQGRPTLANTLMTDIRLDASWNHLAAMQDSTGCRIYLNGQRIGASPSRTRVGGLGMVIGSNPGRRNAFFHGEIVCVALFDEALSDKDLIRLMVRPLVAETVPIPTPTHNTEPDPEIEIEPAAYVDAPTETSLSVLIPASTPVLPPPAPLNDERTIVTMVSRDELARQWSFDCKIEFEGFTHVLQVSIASVETVEALHYEEEVVFSVEIFGKPLLVPIRHRNRISQVDAYDHVFHEHAFVELRKSVTLVYRDEFTRRAIDWIREKVHPGK